MIENIEQAKKHLKEIIDFYKLNDENNYDYTDKDLISIRIVLKEIERLNNRLKISNDTCNYLRNTIDKAIEYIDRRDIEWGSEEHNKLLCILKGADKE